MALASTNISSTAFAPEVLSTPNSNLSLCPLKTLPFVLTSVGPQNKAIDRDLGSCNHAGRQMSSDYPPPPPITPSVPTDLFGRRLDRRQSTINDGLLARRPNWITWPVIGAGLDLKDNQIFDWAPFSDQFHEGTIVCVYIAISDGLCSIGRTSKLSLAKIGISTRLDLSARMAEVNCDRYASLHEADGRIVDSDGFDNWEPIRLPLDTKSSVPSPVERLPRSLMVSLPRTLSVEAFDVALISLLAPTLVSRWINTSDGQIHCARHDVDPRILHRFTAHQNADATIRLKKTQELYIFRRRENTDRLVQAIEGLIIRYLLDEKNAML